jgi:hypothetical protein
MRSKAGASFSIALALTVLGLTGKRGYLAEESQKQTEY